MYICPFFECPSGLAVLMQDVATKSKYYQATCQGIEVEMFPRYDCDRLLMWE